MKKILATLCVTLITLAAFASWTETAGDVPAFHDGPPKKTDKLAPILSGPQLTGTSFEQPFQRHAYELAAKVDKVLYQQPCYCHCDQSVGHTSLRSCFEGVHGAHCGTCLKEAYYTYQQIKLGKKPAQIRAAIEKGEFEKIDLERAATMK